MKKLNQAIDRFCILHPNFGIPNLMLYVVIGNVVLGLLSNFSNGNFLSFFSYTLSGLLHGQVWRLVTFVLIPESTSPFYLLITCYFYYWIGSTLERQWGTAKFTTYYLSGMLLTVVGASIVSLITGYSIPVYGANYVNFAMFMAFALLYPDAQVLLFFVFPIFTCAMGGLRYGPIFRRSLVVLPFVAFIGVFNLFYDREPVFRVGALVVTAGWISFLSIILRGLLSVQALLVLIGLCTSVMWGGIFNLAVEGLGKYTEKASGIFMALVCGGGILPLLQNAIVDVTDGGMGYLTSYWVIVIALAYLLYYALVGSKNVNKDIPVTE